MLKNLSPGRLASLSAVIIFLLSFFIYIATQVGSTEYAILYTDLELEDAKQIVSRLDTSNIKYKLTKNGSEVLVPKDVVNKLRVDTAEIALNSQGASVGYEIFDNIDALGSTNFVQNVNLVRALEGELGRTIRSVDNVKNARVHLVMPKREMFSREEQAPSASVVIRTKRGKLSIKEIQSIQKLIAAAVPKLDVKNVAIVDSSGNLLSNNYDDEQTLTVASNEVVRQEKEKKLISQIQTLLDKTVGLGKSQAQVNIEMDFDQVVTNEEIFDPDSQVVRSQASVTEEGNSGQNDSPVSVSQNIPNSDSSASAKGVYNQNSKTEETINYEISKVVRNKIKNTGTIKRLTVAVMVDGVYDIKDEARVYRDRNSDEMDQLISLVKSSVGFDADRGDVVSVENMRFASAEVLPGDAPEKLILGFTKNELIDMAEGLGVAVVAILVILLVIRPLINNAFDDSGQIMNDARLLSANGDEDNLLLSNFLGDENGELEELVNINKVDGRVKISLLKKLNDRVDKNPDAAVSIIRNWLYNNEM